MWAWKEAAGCFLKIYITIYSRHNKNENGRFQRYPAQLCSLRVPADIVAIKLCSDNAPPTICTFSRNAHGRIRVQKNDMRKGLMCEASKRCTITWQMHKRKN